MVDISSGDKKINITVSTSGNKASVNATPDTAMYYSNKSREWAISDTIVDNEDYSSKYYANVSKQNADKSTATFENLTTNYNEYKTDLENTKNISVEEIETAKTNAISDITNQENLSVDNVNTAGATQVNLAKEQATIATEQAAIATAKTSEVVESGNNAITAITAQETTSKNNIETKGAEQIELIQNEGATQIANVQSTGFYMRDDKLYFINSQGEETEFKSGGSGLEVCDIGMALYVDETKGLRRYLNGQIVDINTNTQAFLNRLKDITTLHPSLLCTEDEWQTAKTLSALGQVGKFVIDEALQTIRLPRVVNVQGLFNLQNLGMTVDAGLPNITGSWNSDTVQPESIQYPYFIQIATGSETENNIVNDIELNNPFSLFDSKYSDHELNNISWLKSEGQWNSKAVYPTAYDKLLKVYNGTETVVGLSVKLSTEDYTDYDFVLNTADETFRLPLSNNQRFVIKTHIDGEKGYRIWSDGYCHQWGKVNGSGVTVTLLKPMSNAYYHINLGGGNSTGWSNNAHSFTYYNVTVNSFQIKMEEGSTLASGMNCNWDVFGYLAEGEYTPQKLYYYVGETVQNANLINAGRIGEQLANKVDLDAQNLSIAGKSLISGLGMPSSKYINLTVGASGSTYTAPANGWFRLRVLKLSGAGSMVRLVSNKLASCVSSPSSGTCTADVFLPVAEGDVVTLGLFNTYGTIELFRFFYAEGAK